MGAYTSGAEVYQLLLDLSVGVNRLSVDDIEPIIAGVEAQINGLLLGQGYATVPATGTNDKALLREQVRLKVAARVYDALYSSQRSPDWVRNAHIDFGEFLTALRKGELRLVDQEPDVAQSGEITSTWFRVMPKDDD